MRLSRPHPAQGLERLATLPGSTPPILFEQWCGFFDIHKNYYNCFKVLWWLDCDWWVISTEDDSWTIKTWLIAQDFFLVRGAPSNQNCLFTFSDQFHSVEVPSFSIMLIKLKVLWLLFFFHKRLQWKVQGLWMHWHLQLLLLQWSGKGSALLLQRYLFTLLGLLLLYDGVLENILFIYLFIYLFYYYYYYYYLQTGTTTTTTATSSVSNTKVGGRSYVTA